MPDRDLCQTQWFLLMGLTRCINGFYFSSVINRHSKSVRLSMYLEGINAGQGLMSDTLVLLMRVTRCIYGFELSILEERSLKYR